MMLMGLIREKSLHWIRELYSLAQGSDENTLFAHVERGSPNYGRIPPTCGSHQIQLTLHEIFPTSINCLSLSPSLVLGNRKANERLVPSLIALLFTFLAFLLSTVFLGRSPSSYPKNSYETPDGPKRSDSLSNASYARTRTKFAFSVARLLLRAPGNDLVRPDGMHGLG